MIKLMVGLMSVVMPVIALAATSSQTSQDYKCHITSAKGEKVIFYRWKMDEASLNAASLPGKQRKSSDGKKYFIKDVVECVPLSQDFTAEASKQLDARTLR
ncbi:TapY2 family type IVa secretion system protein [Shewanella sp. A25]|nr:TapY2 family type IVa secretion system protein [Shewanella shenzhenensis]